MTFLQQKNRSQRETNNKNVILVKTSQGSTMMTYMHFVAPKGIKSFPKTIGHAIQQAMELCTSQSETWVRYPSLNYTPIHLASKFR